MWTIRDIISEALARANVVGRRQVQSAPGDKVMDALDLLRDIAADFTDKNLLQWLQESVIIPSVLGEKLILGESWDMGVNFWIVHNDSELPPVPSAGAWDSSFCWNKGTTVWHVANIGAGMGAWEAHTYGTMDEALAAMTLPNGERAVVEYAPAGMRTEIIVGTLDPDIKHDFVDVQAKNLDKVIAMYYENPYPVGTGEQSYPLGFVEYKDYWAGGWGQYVYTWQPISDTKVKVYIKPRMGDTIVGTSYDLHLIYNKAWSFDLDSEVRAPDTYRSLFLAALTYRCAVRWPRLDPAHTERLKTELGDKIAALSAKTRALKYVVRAGACNNHRLTTQAQLRSGSFIFGG